MNSKNILLIEDEPAIAENVIYALQSEGFHVIWKQFGHEGIAVLRETEVDLLILDVGLPDSSGFELCKQVRGFSRLPIIFLTARSEEVDRVVGLEIGADNYVCKPFSPLELAARVKAILRRSVPNELTAASEAADFIIDRQQNAISYCGKRLVLTRYEYLILTTLLHSPQWVFSRSALMDRVWDEPQASFDRAVDTHIKSIRAKLKAVCDRDPIQTHRGFGYSIKATCDEL